MSDKDLLVVISEMLRKQDQQAEKLEEHSVILNQHTRILDEHTGILNEQSGILNEQSGLIRETNNTLKQYIDISIQQFQLQQNFNERFLNKLGDIEKAINKP